MLQVRNRGNTVDPVGGSVDVSGAGGGRSGAISPVRILPGKMVNVKLMASPACGAAATPRRSP